jgi:dienelactone hydrolase
MAKPALLADSPSSDQFAAFLKATKQQPYCAFMTLFVRLITAFLLMLAAPLAAKVQSFTQEFDNGEGRVVPVSVWSGKGQAKGVILFSHGAFSAPAKYEAISRRWAEAGYLVVAPLHADSSDWTGIKPELKDQTAWRLADMQLAYARLDGLALKAGADIKRAKFVAAGHSFGGLIAMLDSDPRVSSIIAFSPPGPLPGLAIPVVTKPLLTITGTADTNPMMAPEWQAHLAAHRSATGGAWAYIGEGVDHYFGGIFGRPELPGPKAEAAFDETMATTLSFLKKPASATKVKLKAGKLEAR